VEKNAFTFLFPSYFINEQIQGIIKII